MKLADGNKPIEIGDTSYIYKGVYNPIYWIGKEPYRPRVETLVIKDGEYLYADIDDNIDKVPSDLRFKKYSVPGGSLDADSTKIQQAEAETNEEALVKVTRLYHSGIQYYELYEPGFILKGGDTPLEYKGSITDLYVGIYDGLYDKNKVEPKDLDSKMAEHGGFHKIISISKYLRREHIDALISSPFVKESVKINLRLQRRDIINESAILAPNNKIYHASIYEIEEFKPMSLDLGNAFDEPGWSTFCFGDYEYAKVFGFMRALENKVSAYHKINPIFNKGHIVISMDAFLYLQEHDFLDRPLLYYVYTIDSSELNLGVGNDPSLKEYTFRESGIRPINVDRFELSMMDFKDIIEINNTITSGEEESDNKILMSHDYQKEVEMRNILTKAISNGELQPGDNIEDFMNSKGISFNDNDIRIPDLSLNIDEPVFDNIDFSNVIESKYPIDCYGLPDRKAYPMPDENHVRSAIKFFNYAKEDEEKELASNINKKIKEFNIKDITVGDKNRFKKYYKPIVESYGLEEYESILKNLFSKLNDASNNSEKLKVYEQMISVVKMFVYQLENGVFNNLNEDTRSSLVSACYNAIAEMSLNRLEVLSKDQESDNSLIERNNTFAKYVSESVNHVPLMEADDEEDDEVATDYTAMADEEAGGEDNDDIEPEGTDRPEDGGPDEGGGETDDNERENGDTADEAGNQEEETGDTGNEETGTDTGEDVTDYTAMADEEAGTDTGE